MGNMSNNSNLKEDNFTLVRYKRKGFKNTRKIAVHKKIGAPTENKEWCDDDCIRRIEAAKNDILSSDFYNSVSASFRESLKTLGNPKISEIVSFGLGSIAECMISRYQLAFLLCIRDFYQAKTYVYDPIFTERDREILEKSGCKCLPENFEAKYKVEDNCTTIFYLPHCPNQLCNNLLWANWSLQLNNCIIVSNGFTNIVETQSKRLLLKNAQYILNISPHVHEVAIINTFKYYDIFNDTAIHVFPLEKLRLITEEFWNSRDEPEYVDIDAEFITNNSDISR